MINTSKVYQDYVVFVESKSLRGRCKAEYLRQVRKLAEYYPSRSLKQLTERQVFDYLIYRRDEQKLRPSTLNQAVVALRMFYREFLQRDWQLWRQFEIRRDQPLPLVLTRDETKRLLGSIRSNRFKAILCLIYHCGLRVGEATTIRPQDIDSARQVIRILNAKGGKNREVPVAPAMIERLRAYWCAHRNRGWLLHVLPKGFVAVRHFGWLSAAAGRALRRVRFLLGRGPVIKPPPRNPSSWLCPRCQEPMLFAGGIPPVRGPPLSHPALCFAA
jgi:integrase/recombinase XerD